MRREVKGVTRGRVHLLCLHCGNAKVMPRLAEEPRDAVRVETNECDICEAANGGFGEIHYRDRAGALVWPSADDETGGV